MKLDKIRRWGLAAAIAGSMTVLAAIPPAPGVVNFIEGQATLNGQQIGTASVGSVQLQSGQTLQTEDGRAEVLLSPGVFLRLGHNSEVRMQSPSLLDTRVQLVRGNALVEAADLKKESSIRVLTSGAQATLLKKGLYRFNADNESLAVYDGKAQVESNDKTAEVKGGREVNLQGAPVVRKFDKKATEQQDPLYAWSELRSQYLSDASAVSARTYVNGGWYGSGFYWNPWYRTYAWLPGDAYFYSPFGPAYYSPWAFGGPFAYGPTYYYRVRPVRPGGLHGHFPHRVQPGINPGLGRRPVTNGAIRPSGGIRSGGSVHQGGIRPGLGGHRR